jgi:hypothetical protein
VPKIIAVAPIPLQDPIASPRRSGFKPSEKDPYEGRVTDAWVKYFTARDETLLSSSVQLVRIKLVSQQAAIPSTPLPIGAVAQGQYRLDYYLRETQAAGTSSSLQVSFGWTDGGTSMSYTGAALTGNTPGTFQSGHLYFDLDASSPVTYSTSYTSVGSPSLDYKLVMVIEQVTV